MNPANTEEVLLAQQTVVREFWAFICSRPKFDVLPELNLDVDRFYLCSRCNAFHVFRLLSPFRGLRSAVAGKPSGALFNLKRAGTISSEAYDEALQQVIAVRDLFNNEVDAGNASYVEKYAAAHPKVNIFVPRHGFETAGAAYIFDGVYRPTDEYIIPISQLPEALLLEFWECGRKKGHPSIEKAEKALRQTLKKTERNDLSVYQCRHCNLYHFGHSGKRQGRKVGFNATRRRSARDYYMQNSVRANKFIHKLMFS